MTKYNVQAKAPRDHYQEVTDRIVTALEQGVKPWAKGWDDSKAGGFFAPVNATTGKNYRGINTLILGMDARAFETGDPRWCSYNQAQARKWQVRKGEKGTTIFFFKKLTVDDEKAEDGTKQIPMLRAYSVFHASQIDGIPPRVKPTVDEAPWTKPEAAQIILANSGAVIRTGGPRAFYSPGTDHIQLPPHEAFTGPAAWSATALHELGHWTGHPSRLARDLSGRFGSGAYAQEELRAELGSVFVGSTLGLPVEIPNHASYIDNWLKALRHDKREIFRAAADAQKIADHCLGFHPAYAVKMKADAATPDTDDAPAAPAAGAQIGQRRSSTSYRRGVA